MKIKKVSRINYLKPHFSVSFDTFKVIYYRNTKLQVKEQIKQNKNS